MVQPQPIQRWNSVPRLPCKATIETPTASQSGHVEIDVAHRESQVHAKFELVRALHVAEHVGLLELIRLLEFRKEIGRAQASETSALRRLRDAASTVDANASYSSTESRIVLHTENPETRQGIRAKRLLRSERIAASPCEAEFVEHP